jgi:hypothetical protein
LAFVLLQAKIAIKCVQSSSTQGNGFDLHTSVPSRLSLSVGSVSEQLVFECHIGFWLETDAGAEDVGQGVALLG